MAIKKVSHLGNATSKALNKIRLDIASGTLRPNQPISEIELTKQIGMSRTPIREAIRQLETLGYLIRLGNHRLVVADRSLDDIRDTLETREALETMTIKLTCQRATKKNFEIIIRNHKRCNLTIKNKEPAQFFKANWEFHKATFLACGNKNLWLQIENNKENFFIIKIPFLFNDQDWQRTKMEHQEILEALLDRDENRAIEATKKHIKTAFTLFNKGFL